MLLRLNTYNGCPADMLEHDVQAYEFGPFLLYPDRRLLLKDGQPISLTSKALETLLVLIRNHSRIVSKDELLQLVWPDTIVEDRNLAVNVSTVRRALGETPTTREYIVTVPGRGYRFVAPIREVNATPVENASPAEDEAASAEPVAKVPPPTRFQGKWKPAALVVLVVAGLGGAFAVGRYSAVTRRPAVRLRAITNIAGVEGQPAFSPDGRSVTFVSDRGGQHDIFVVLLSGGSLVRVTNDSNVKSRPRWSPDGSRIVYAKLNDWGSWDLWVVSALGGGARIVISNAADPAWSPDGRSLAYANLATGTIWMSDPTGGAPREITNPEPQVRHRQPAFSREGRKLAFVRRPAMAGPYGELSIIGLGGGPSRQITNDGAFVGSPVWSMDGLSLYFASGRNGAINVSKVAVAGGTPEQITLGQGDDADLDMSPDGRRIVFSSYRTNIDLAEITFTPNGEPARKWLTRDAVRSELSPSYSRDGTRITYFTNRRGTENESVWVMSASGDNPAQAVEADRVNIFPRWSPGGQWLIYGSRAAGPGFWSELELRRVASAGGPPQTLPFRVADYFGDIGQHGRLLYRGEDGTAKIFDLSTKHVRTLNNVAGSHFRWCPNAQRFAVLVNAQHENDSAAGVWVHDLSGNKRQVFAGWASYFGWADDNSIVVLEGKPDLKATVWRVKLDGSVRQRLGWLPLIYSYWHVVVSTRFDVHPDGQRVVAEQLDSAQSDLTLLENIW